MKKPSKQKVIAAIKSRLTNKVTLVALASAILGALFNVGVIDSAELDKYTDAINYIIMILVAVGIVHNPEKK